MNTNTNAAPVLTLLRGVRLEGDLSVVTPGPVDHLHDRDLAILTEAERLHAGGETKRAAEMILKLEERLGITQADRLAAAQPAEPWEDDLVAALEGMSAESEPEQVQALPRASGRLNEPEERAAIAAQAEFDRAKNKGNKALATEKLVRIDSRRNQRVELKERAAGIAETVALAKGRGEEVDEKPSGPIRVVSRDGLRRMADLGHITGEQLRVGLIYRSGHEERGADLKAQVITDAGGSGGHDNDAFVAKRLERAKLLDFVARVDRAVALGCISNPAALQMLRHVAGQGGNIYDFGKGKGLERRRTALVAALDVATKVWRDTLAHHLVHEANSHTAS